MQIINVLQNYGDYLDQTIETNGWIKTCRKQKQMLFIHITDGTSQNTLQIIVSPEFIHNINEFNNLSTGTSIKVVGKLVASPAKGQNVELIAHDITIYQQCDPLFPLQKVGLTLDFQRTIPHLRHRTNIMRAVFTVKSKALSAIHKFFLKKIIYI
nr:asparaginyl tRNA synthetase [Mimivirus sp.]